MVRLLVLAALMGCGGDKDTDTGGPAPATGTATGATGGAGTGGGGGTGGDPGTGGGTATGGTATGGTATGGTATGTGGTATGTGTATGGTGTGGTGTGGPDPFSRGPHGYSATLETIDLGPRSSDFPSEIEATIAIPDVAPAPVVVLNHGFVTAIAAYDGTVAHLATHGFVVIAPQYDSGVLTSRTHTGLAEDTIAVLDWIEAQATSPGSLLDGQVDVDQIGLVGHSRGGKQSFLTALRDDRVDAIFAIDPVDTSPGPPDDYPSVTPEFIAGVAVPVAYVGAGLAGTGGTGALVCAPEDENHRQYFTNGGSPAWEYVFPNAGHMDFTDPCARAATPLACRGCAIGDDPMAYRDLSRALAAAFLRLHLLGDEAFRPWVDAPQDFISSVAIEVDTK